MTELVNPDNGPAVADVTGARRDAAVLVLFSGPEDGTPGVLPDDALPVARAIAEEAAAHADVTHLAGKGVHELSVLRADKGTALRALATTLGVDASVYLGDDVTDEHVFEAARAHDVTIKVGEGQTSARYRVAGCEDVPEVLRALRAARAVGLQR